jgi:predicted transcriptional regulator
MEDSKQTSDEQPIIDALTGEELTPEQVSEALGESTGEDAVDNTLDISAEIERQMKAAGAEIADGAIVSQQREAVRAALASQHRTNFITNAINLWNSIYAGFLNKVGGDAAFSNDAYAVDCAVKRANLAVAAAIANQKIGAVADEIEIDGYAPREISEDEIDQAMRYSGPRF